MSARHKNKFAKAALHKLVDLNLTITALAAKIGRPRSTVSRAIHAKAFPKVRLLVAQELGIKN